MIYGFNDDKSKYDISNVASLISRIEELERQVGDFNANVATLQSAMSSLENDLSDFNDDITNLSNDIDAMSVIGTHYQAAKSVAITNTDIDNYAEGLPSRFQRERTSSRASGTSTVPAVLEPCKRQFVGTEWPAVRSESLHQMATTHDSIAHG